MVIKASSSREIQQLVAAICGEDDVGREAAVARLTVIGARCADRLFAAYDSIDEGPAKSAMFRVFEALADRRLLPRARAAIVDGGDLAVAAAAALRGLVDRADATATEALDTLVAVALDPACDRRVRLAAYEALQGMPEDLRAPILSALSEDSNRRGGPDETAIETGTDAVWRNALEGTLPDRAGALLNAVRGRGPTATLGALPKLIDLVRGKESSARSAAVRADWRTTRGELHQALAIRGSRVAVYDLRESLTEAQQPLEASFVTALHAIGDPSCLEPIALAYSRARREDAAWRRELVSVFRAISRRGGITRRHAVMKRIAARWPEAARDLTAP